MSWQSVIERSELPPQVSQGAPARLLPLRAPNEGTATSSFLACLTAVDEFADVLFSLMGYKVGTRAKIHCYTEVVLETRVESKGSRPDGLIIIDTGRQRHLILVEAKIGNAQLSQAQVEEYLTLAKATRMAAVLTISNQFAAHLDHHPIQVPAKYLKSVNLYHLSWVSIVQQAALLAKGGRIRDADQAWILTELLRYLTHPNSGVQGFDRMGSEWKDVANKLFRDEKIGKTDAAAKEVVSQWHQLSRFTAIQLSLGRGTTVEEVLPRKSVQDPAYRFTEDLAHLISHAELHSTLRCEGLDHDIHVVALPRRRAITIASAVNASDHKTALPRVKWLLKELEACADESIEVRANWPGRAATTVATLGELRLKPELLLPERKGMVPSAFEIVQRVDLAGRFIQQQNFVQDLHYFLGQFVNQVAIHLKAFKPRAPKVKEPLLAASELAG